jgi:hypothetical protein
VPDLFQKTRRRCNFFFEFQELKIKKKMSSEILTGGNCMTGFVAPVTTSISYLADKVVPGI